MNSTLRTILRIALPVVVLVAAGAVAAMLLMSREAPERAERAERRVLVETIAVDKALHKLDVEAAGTVIAARDLVVQPQVQGRIIWVNERLVPGGVIRQGEPLFKIDPSDYRLAVAEQQTALAQAQAQLEQERGRQQVAQREWELFEEEAGAAGEPDDPSLALREPQLRSARVAVDAARARLERAQLDLSRTTVEAPFDAVVESESAEVGQLVNSQAQVARIVGTDTFWVRLSIPVDRINYIDVPGVNASEGSPVRIAQDIGERTIEHDGRVARLLGDLDQTGRMAQVLVAIDDPFGLADLARDEDAPRGVPLLLNSYVGVEIAGPRTDALIEVPREAIHGGDTVYVYDDGELDIRQVSVAWSRPQTVLIGQGLADGDRIITSPIATPIDGMKLRTPDEPTREDTTAETTDADPSEPADEADAGAEDIRD